MVGLAGAQAQHAGANILGDMQGAFDRFAGKQHGEFLAAIARPDIARTAHAFGNAAGGMPLKMRCSLLPV
jgi:hypothetical protein